MSLDFLTMWLRGIAILMLGIAFLLIIILLGTLVSSFIMFLMKHKIALDITISTIMFLGAGLFVGLLTED